MQSFAPTIIWRHRRENLKKCSLRGLENREDFKFFCYPDEPLPDLHSYLLLSIDGPPLDASDCHSGLLILDATWRYAEKMRKSLLGRAELQQRSIPAHFRTAYPRKQTDCLDPERGLASIEAIYVAYTILGRNTDHLLDNYYWKEQFLALNRWG